MATDYTDGKAALDEIGQTITSSKAKLNQAKQTIEQAEATLAGIPTKYSAIIADIDQRATDNPNNEAMQMQKSEKDAMAANFTTLRQRATALKTAVDGI